MGEIRLLPGMKFMSGGVLYRPGDSLPDTESARNLVKQKKAEKIETPVEDADPAPEGYEKENVRDLVNLTKERGIDIPKGTTKAGIIELLRAWDADQADHDEGDEDEGNA